MPLTSCGNLLRSEYDKADWCLISNFGFLPVLDFLVRLDLDWFIVQITVASHMTE